MEFQDIEKSAYRSDGADKSWDLPSKYAYLQMEKLYHNYKTGAIDKESSIKRKVEIEKEFRNNKIEYDRNIEINKEYTQNRIDNSILLSAIERSSDTREMLEFALTMIAKYVKDDSLVARNLGKIIDTSLN